MADYEIVRQIHRRTNGVEGSTSYVAEEAVQGLRLTELLRQRRLSLTEALRLFKDRLAGLGAVHSKGAA